LSEKEEYLKYMNNPPIQNFINDILFRKRQVDTALYDDAVDFTKKSALIRGFIDCLPPVVAAKDLKSDYELLISVSTNAYAIKTKDEQRAIWKRVCDWCYDNLFKQHFAPLQGRDFESLEGEENES
jgi:hypothetical protein